MSVEIKVEAYGTVEEEGILFTQYVCTEDNEIASAGEISGRISECSVVEFAEGAWVDENSVVQNKSCVLGKTTVFGSVLDNCFIQTSHVTSSSINDMEVRNSSLDRVNQLLEEYENEHADRGILTKVFVSDSKLFHVNILPGEGSPLIKDSHLLWCDLAGRVKIVHSTCCDMDFIEEGKNKFTWLKVGGLDEFLNGFPCKGHLFGPNMESYRDRLRISKTSDLLTVQNIGIDQDVAIHTKGSFGVTSFSGSSKLTAVYDRLRGCVFFSEGADFFGTVKDFDEKIKREYPIKGSIPDIQLGEYWSVIQLVKVRFRDEDVDWDATLNDDGTINYSDNFKEGTR